MSRGLVWHPEDGTRSFSLLSPPASSPAFPMRSREDRQTQNASATCSTWDGPVWRNCKEPEEKNFSNEQQTDIYRYIDIYTSCHKKSCVNMTTWDKRCRTNLPSPLLLHTSKVSITIFPRALRDTFCRKRWMFSLYCVFDVNSYNNKSEKQIPKVKRQ